jgi:hypothetical protein
MLYTVEPFSDEQALTDMDSWIVFAALLALWLILQVWVLPRLGVPT